MKRRKFIKTTAAVSASLSVGTFTACSTSTQKEEAKEIVTEGKATVAAPIFKISLAEWSFHNAIFGDSIKNITDWQDFAYRMKNDYQSIISQGSLKNIDFPAKARSLGFDAVEYVNTCFFDRARDTKYLAELKNRCEGEGIQSLLIMCDNEGAIGNSDAEERKKSVEAHYKWVEAAAFLGCHSIRVNAQSSGTYEEQQKGAAEGLRMLGEFADGHGINVIVENHGGFSSNGKWLVEVMKMADHPRVGTLPDFGNFRISETEMYDRYQGVTELMPYAKAVSAKAYDFNPDGNEVDIDYHKMMKIVLDAGYRGYVGIEFEGSNLPEEEGILQTKQLLERVREELTPQYS
ncbi:sugar phosphate isomerase/epimerase family protein [Flammeovirgaceae bacterium SG7u.111]|nr:sugar phosphate isomerase/epimerase family protein [Flammeovirgaceae bacterium SG7u.132]WPO34731.1 sugar phosphate isomerase/epimerase family protein [Flammeovirgaceae bacterium SG7u.111]